MRYITAIAIAGLIFGLVLRHYGGGEPVGMTMLIALVVLPLAGVLITIDDDLPGGFSNPDGTTRPPWTSWESWADLLARGAISGFGFAIDAVSTVGTILSVLLGCFGLVASIAIQKHIGSKVAEHAG